MSSEVKSEDDLLEEIGTFLQKNFPQIQMHGGSAAIQNLDRESGEVSIQLGGACSLGTLEQMALAIDNEKLQKSLERAEDKLMGIIDNADTARELELLLHRHTDPSAKTIRLDQVLEDRLADAESTYPGARFNYPDELPAVTVVADESINRILTQVIDNAVTHNEKETALVHISISESEKTVLLSIADNGPGVPPERRDRIFGREEISQIDHGGGFSLFFVDQVMDLYGGDVWIEDSDLGGAVCNLQFPRPH